MAVFLLFKKTMKKVITISSLMMGVVFLAGCSGQQPVSQTQSAMPNSVAQNSAANQSPATSGQKKDASAAGCGGQVKDASGITYGTVLAEDGKCWLDRNLGATEVATSSTDAASYGWYFQWGRGADGHQIPTSGTTATLSSTDTPGNAKFIASDAVPFDWRNPQNDNLWQGVNGKNNPCPSGFRLPTSEEWIAFVSTSNIKDPATAFSSSLKLTLAGERYVGNDGLGGQGSGGFYWSSSPNSNQSTQSSYLVFGSGGVHPAGDGYGDHAVGFSVRCIKN